MKEGVSLEDLVDVLVDEGVKLAKENLFDRLLDLKQILLCLTPPLPDLVLPPHQPDLVILPHAEAVEEVHLLPELFEGCFRGGALFEVGAGEVGVGYEC